MPSLDQIVIANSASPGSGGTWDLVGASWDMLTAPTVPIQADFVLLVSLLLTGEEASSEHQLALALIAPNGSTVGGMRANVGRATDEQLATLPEGEPIRVETVMGAKGVVFPEHGMYDLNILWDDRPLRQPMKVRIAEGETPEGGG
jgi:hypothetical protein